MTALRAGEVVREVDGLTLDGVPHGRSSLPVVCCHPYVERRRLLSTVRSTSHPAGYTGAGPRLDLGVRRQPAPELVEGAGAWLRPRQEHVVPGALDADIRDVPAQRRRPTADLLHVEHDVGRVDVLARL